MKCDSRYRRPYLSTTAVLSFLSIAVLAAPSFAQPANPEDVQEGYEFTPEDSFNSELKSHISLQSRSAYKGHVQKQGDRYIAYIGHHNFDNAGNGGKGTLNPMTGEIEPNGTSIVDVTDPTNPVYLHHLPAHDGETQARNINTCAGDDLPEGEPGHYYLMRGHGNTDHELYDVTDPSAPVFMEQIEGGLEDNHKNYWDCETGIALLTGWQPGWHQRSTSIFDMKDPKNPKFIRYYSLPFMQPDQNPEGHRETEIHEALIHEGKVYMSYGTGEEGIIQVLNLDKLIHGDFDPKNPTNEQLADPVEIEIVLPFYWGAHTVIPLLGYADPPGWDTRAEAPGHREYLVSIAEETGNDCSGHSLDLALFFDITDPEHPVGINNYYAAKFDAERTGKTEQEIMDHACDIGGRYGTHSTALNYFAGSGNDPYYGKILWLSYFNGGARALDIRNPYNLKEVGYYIPASNEELASRNGKVVIQTNNLDTDDRGYVYLFDRANAGMDIIVPTGEAAAIAGIKPES